jgi:hypothetical protein
MDARQSGGEGAFLSGSDAGAFFGNERIRHDVDLVTVRVNYRWVDRLSRSTDLC